MNADRPIAELARSQHGIVTRGQLLASGLSPKTIRTERESGGLVPVHRGVYRLGALVGALEPERAREMAAVLACGAGAVVSHGSAAGLWDLLGSNEFSSSDVHVTVPGGVRRRRPGIRCYRSSSLSAASITAVLGIPVTTPVRTLADLAVVVPPRALIRAAARAERKGLVTAGTLDGLADRRAGRPGAPTLRAALDRGVALTRSEAEERFLDLVRAGRLPEPEANVMVGPYEVDFLWRAERLIAEVDGFRYHRSRRSFETDRQRDTTLTARGFVVFRVTWRQLVDDRDATLSRLAGALASRAGS